MPRLSANARVIGLTPTPIHPHAAEPCACRAGGPFGCAWPGVTKLQIRTTAPAAMRMRLSSQSQAG